MRISVFFILSLQYITLKAKKNKNHVSCYDILNTWWNDRVDLIKELKQDNNLITWDTICSKFNGMEEVCHPVGQEREFIYEIYKNVGDPPLTSEEMNTPCNMLGAKSKVCAGNPCNHYNTGKCTLQNTGGLCNWYTKKQASKYGLMYGCQRNRCHLGGLGKIPRKQCEDRSIPGFIGCTYCRGTKDSKLKGKGMGCQRIDVKTSAQCAPINSGIPPDDTVWMLKKKKKCQCSDDTLVCSKEVESMNTKFVKRFS